MKVCKVVVIIVDRNELKCALAESVINFLGSQFKAKQVSLTFIVTSMGSLLDKKSTENCVFTEKKVDKVGAGLGQYIHLTLPYVTFIYGVV
jgi:hypothetical protein